MKENGYDQRTAERDSPGQSQGTNCLLVLALIVSLRQFVSCSNLFLRRSTEFGLRTTATTHSWHKVVHLRKLQSLTTSFVGSHAETIIHRRQSDDSHVATVSIPAVYNFHVTVELLRRSYSRIVFRLCFVYHSRQVLQVRMIHLDLFQETSINRWAIKSSGYYISMQPRSPRF